MIGVTCAVQEQLKQEVASLQKQLASQKRKFEEETKAQEQLQEAHEKELRHLKRDIKHKQVSLPNATCSRDWMSGCCASLLSLLYHAFAHSVGSL